MGRHGGEPAMRQMIGTKVKERHAEQWLALLAPLLYPGEIVTALSKTNMVGPICNAMAVTNARVLAFISHELESGKGIAQEVPADRIARADLTKKGWRGESLWVTTRDGEEICFGSLPSADEEMILGVVRHLGMTGTAPEVRQAVAHQADSDRQHQDLWAQVGVLGDPLSDKAWKAIQDHCTPGETPRFVIGAGADGVFAAFADRAMIVKVGALTSLLAGSFGGGRVTTFPYTEITGIEYNAGMALGVLEVLTPSYSGAAGNDLWRDASTSRRHAESNDPREQSNCLPLRRSVYQQALPRLNEMRTWIAEAKRPTVVVTAPVSAPAPGGGLADELGKLAALRDQGVLSDDEFHMAKQRTLAKHGMG